LTAVAASIGGARASARSIQATHTVPHKLIVVLVDGLDWRYLRDRDRMGLSIPNLRRLMDRGAVAQGIVGVPPTVTWPSHPSIVTGVRPDQHVILGNRRPASEGGDYYTRTLPALYLLRDKQPDLLLVHLVDLDAEQHERGPFEMNSNAMLERYAVRGGLRANGACIIQGRD
jgi:predicted AlkP superfamily pyrophosphatase or phosphodiesterase